jgi:murein L,D-transpeptidase YcbB/YkuD
MNSFAPWQRADRCVGGPRPGAVALLSYLRNEFPQGRSLGIYNCRTVRGAQVSSIHSEGRALDWGVPMVNGKGSPEGHKIVALLAAHGSRLGIQAIIYDRKIWSAASPNGRNYNGIAPHYDHLHIELTRNSGENLTLATLYSVLGSSKETEVQPAPAPTAPPTAPGPTPTVPPFSPSAVCKRQVLRLSSRGPCVTSLQRRLNVLGFNAGAPDGVFGNKTDAAVRSFQASKRLTVDGIVGPKTWGAL